jgi:hypothetical protein
MLHAKPLSPILLLASGLAGAPPAEAAYLTEIGQSFIASRYSVNTSFLPPDTMGAVGPDHFVELINGRYSVYSKTGTNNANGTRTAVQTSTLNQFWTNAGVTPSGSFAFDPRVLYDGASQRWFAAAVDNSGNANNFLVAVSDSSNPTAGWTGFKIDSDADNSHWADFPMLGMDRDAVYVTANMFPLAGGAVNTTALVLPKNDLTAATPSVANLKSFQNVSTGFASQPAVNLDGEGIAAGQVLASGELKSAGLIAFSTLGGSLAAPVLTPLAGAAAVTPRAAPPDADQPGAAQNLDNSDTRFSGNVVIQGGSLWGVESVEVAGRSALEWYRFDLGLGTVESGLVTDPLLDFFYPSIAVNEAGKIVIGFGGSGADQYASAYALIGEFDGLTTVFDAAPLLLKAGTNTYQRLDGVGRNRWGDYSATTLDPTDDNRFWTIQMFANGLNSYATYVTELIVTPVPEPSTLALFAAGWMAARRRRWGGR